MNAQSVVVVGAGITGLTCAYRLKQRGHAVTVIESAAQVGGVIQTKTVDGFLCEEGPNSFQGTAEILDIIRATGLSNEMVSAADRLPRYIFHRGRLHVAPMGPTGLLSTRLLSAAGKFRILRELWLSPKRDAREESVAEFVIRRFGPETLQNLVAPFISGVYAGDPGLLSIQSVFPSLLEFESESGSVLKGFFRSVRKSKSSTEARRLCSFQQGLHSLPRALAAAIGPENILLKAKAEKVETKCEGENANIIVHGRTEKELFRRAAGTVVISVPAYRCAELLAPLSQALARELRSIDYPPLAGICVAYKRSEVPHSLEGFGFLVPRNQGVRLLGCVWSSSLFPGRAPEGSVLFTAFAGGATDPEPASWSDGRIVEMLRSDLRTTLGIAASPRVIALQRYTHAIPQYTIGHNARCQRIENELKNLPGLRLAGNYLRGVSLGDCVKQANKLASLVIL